ncbi:hypothetical protein [Fimbriiglobus ruber]|uniref:Uncharacterized protein n=1 Tax=Fimbriiglobus ruber TaxID=1908690 RepID=A0A225DGD0_9BACT|nr:hypothetical protein [Fimbriiglobus ruber]OWK40580.1 hypothetical protein FRUB_05499 [Fimbriiglobus ruber]
MTAPSISTVVRELLTGDINMTADDIIQKARTRGVTAPPVSIRDVVYNIRSELKKRIAVTGTVLPKQKQAVAAAAAAAPIAPSVHANGTPDLATVFGNVTLVSQLVEKGGVTLLREVAEAVQVCGGTETFLKHLDLVAGIRASEKTA